ACRQPSGRRGGGAAGTRPPADTLGAVPPSPEGAIRLTAEHPARDTPPATGRVVVVGSANVDLVVPVPRHPAGGETVLGGSLARHPGGKGANQAVAAARAGGADTSFIGALGSDESGDLLRESLESAGVDTALVTRVPEPTGT